MERIWFGHICHIERVAEQELARSIGLENLQDISGTFCTGTDGVSYPQRTEDPVYENRLPFLPLVGHTVPYLIKLLSHDGRQIVSSLAREQWVQGAAILLMLLWVGDGEC